MKNPIARYISKGSACLIAFFMSYFLLLGLSDAQVMKKRSVILPTGKRIKALIADTSEKQTSGLMGYSHLKPSEGMLFVFDKSEPHMMWMKNMIMSIDILWMNDKKEIIEIIPSIPPCKADPCPIYGPSLSSRYVLEISNGASSAYQLKRGMMLKFP